MRIFALLFSLVTVFVFWVAFVESPNAGPSTYTEKHRPRWHFTPDSMWMNDPNGMVFYEGEYHLFYQYYPDSNVWGPMHWGHAISQDLVHWDHLPIALFPDSLGYIFSGSAVIDWNNTSGLGTAADPPMVAIFTYHDPVGERAGRNDFQSQAIAYSLDRGRSWTKYHGNPVVPNPGIRDFRDPKVIWHEESQKWVMVFAAGDHLKLYTSPDLKNWTYASDFGAEIGAHAGVWECPDLFPLRDPLSGESHWVILSSINPGGPNGGSATQYFIGDFDGQSFVVDPDFFQEGEEAVWLDHGRDNYAGVTWSDAPNAETQRLFIGWMSNWQYATLVPTVAWRSAMTMPRTIRLGQSEKGLRLFSAPVENLQQLRRASHTLTSQTIEGNQPLEVPVSPAQLEVILRVKQPNNSMERFGIRLENDQGDVFRMGYEERPKPGFFSDRTQSGETDFAPAFGETESFAPIHTQSDTLELHFFFDHSSVELFVNRGEVVMTEIYFPQEPFSRLSLFSEGGDLEVLSGTFFELMSIW